MFVTHNVSLSVDWGSILGTIRKFSACDSWLWGHILETMTLDLACEKYLLSLFNSSF